MSDIREPAVAGQFYEHTRDGLYDQLTQLFQRPLGPGGVPPQRAAGPRQLNGLVVPHAGYPFSGPIAAYAFAALAIDGPPGVAVLLGPNHRMIGPALAVAPHDSWVTPFATVDVDVELRTALESRMPALEADRLAHRQEHALEVQLPFLQMLSPVPSILPIAIGDTDEASMLQLGEAIVEAVRATERDAVIIASTDLTHYEPPRLATERDIPVLRAMCQADPVGLLSHVESTNHSMCGAYPTAAMLAGVNAFGESASQLYTYATSKNTGPRQAHRTGVLNRVEEFVGNRSRAPESEAVAYCAVGFAQKTLRA